MLIIDNLNLMVTRNCNFRCQHCLRGESMDSDINDSVLRKVFKHGTVIPLLQLNGGEVFSKPYLLGKINEIIQKNNIVIEAVSIVSNGTLYTPQIERQLDILNYYISKCNLKYFNRMKPVNVSVEISQDPYHAAELERIKLENPRLYADYVENIRRLRESRYYTGSRELYTIINSGRAKELNVEKVDSLPFNIYYYEVNTVYGRVFRVSSLGIDIKGTICNSSGEMPPQDNQIFGNVKSESIEEIVKRTGIRCTDEDEYIEHYTKDSYEKAVKMGGGTARTFHI